MEHNTDSEAVTKQLETVTVSAAPRWNIELASLKRIQSGTYNFGESKDDDAINKTAGKVTGVLSHLTINVANTSTDHAKGVKGLEATNEPVTFDVKISNQWRRQGASTPIANQPNPFGKSNRRDLSNPVPVAYWLSSRSPICNWRFCSSNLA